MKGRAPRGSEGLWWDRFSCAGTRLPILGHQGPEVPRPLPPPPSDALAAPLWGLGREVPSSRETFTQHPETLIPGPTQWPAPGVSQVALGGACPGDCWQLRKHKGSREFQSPHASQASRTSFPFFSWALYSKSEAYARGEDTGFEGGRTVSWAYSCQRF